MSVVVAGQAIAVFNVAGHLYALDDACIRCGSSLAIGRVNGMTVVCCGCRWRYDVRSGSVRGIPGLQIDTFNVAIVDTHVMIDAVPIPNVR